LQAAHHSNKTETRRHCHVGPKPLNEAQQTQLATYEEFAREFSFSLIPMNEETKIPIEKRRQRYCSEKRKFNSSEDAARLAEKGKTEVERFRCIQQIEKHQEKHPHDRNNRK
jgi:hypothetical protein